MKNLIGLKKNVVCGGPKYKSQTKIFDQIETIFEKALIERDKLIKQQVNDSMKDKIIILDLRIAMCIKKRARVTLGGYSYLSEEMYGWEPFYDIDRRLLPKTVP
tara:strand:- start:16 stop:327 length:312 start_codon:yes stop_codon:yes gene_type:complete